MTQDRTYEVRVAGLVPSSVLVGLEDVELAAPELRTVLNGTFRDQAALHGFLHRLRGLGLEVVELRAITEAPSSERT
jgi:hypothetical protein